MLQGTILDVPAVEKQVLHSVVRATVSRVYNKTRQCNLAVLSTDRNESLFDVSTKKVSDSLRPAFRRRQIMNDTFIVLEKKVNLGMGECDPRKSFANMSHLGLGRFQELPTNWRIKK